MAGRGNSFWEAEETQITSKTTLPFHDESKTVQNRDDTSLLTLNIYKII